MNTAAGRNCRTIKYFLLCILLSPFGWNGCSVPGSQNGEDGTTQADADGGSPADESTVDAGPDGGGDSHTDGTSDGADGETDAGMDAADGELPDGDDKPDGDKPDGDGDIATDDGQPGCVSSMSLPVQYEVLTGFSGSEDFAFDDDGSLVSTRDGHLTRQTRDGQVSIVVPNLGETAGMVFLPGGDLVVALMENDSLLRVSSNGSSQVILAGLEYPNGMEVDMQGYVYVSEQNAGRVRQIDADSGEYTIIAEGLDNPNGLSFGPEYRTLYVVSFGGGTVHAIDRNGHGGFDRPRLFAMTPYAPAAACEGRQEGDECTDGYGLPGTCQDDGFGHLVCYGSAQGGCQGLSAGDVCRTWDWLPGVCEDWGWGLECIQSGDIPDKFREACEGLTWDDPCTIEIDGEIRDGLCQDWWGYGLMCVRDGNPDYDGACEGLQVGDSCLVDDWGWIMGGVCREKDDGSGLTCHVDDSGAYHGGLDGLETDECGYVYVTEYTVGTIWRFTPDGSEVEELFSPQSTWIPNLHFGSGLGGWDSHTLYVMDRDEGRIFAATLDVGGKQRPFP